MKKLNYISIGEYAAILLVFLFITTYTYAYLFKVPYLGILFNPSNGSIDAIYRNGQQDVNIQIGDQITKFGTLSFDAYKSDQNQNFFSNLRPGDEIVIEIKRNERIIPISFTVSNLIEEELRARLSSQWWTAYVFWLFGTLAILIVRPKRSDRLLLIGFNYLTAVWLIAGAPSAYRIWGSQNILRAAIWLCVPVYWHFHHQVFMQQVHRRSSRFWIISYAAAGILAILEIFNLFPNNAYFLGFILAVIGSVIFIILQSIRNPAMRKKWGFLGSILSLIFIPILLTTIIGALGLLDFSTLPMIGFLVFPALPGAYFYTFFRRQLGNLEIRTNRVVIIYIYGLLLLSVVLLTMLFINILSIRSLSALSTILLSVAAGISSIIVFPHFERWAEKRILGLPTPPGQILETVATQLTTSLNQDHLTQVFRTQVLPTLLVRQSALFQLDENLNSTLVFEDGIHFESLPGQEEIKSLVDEIHFSNHEMLTPDTEGTFHWVKAAFPLEIEKNLIGIWLIGRRDPDDYYSPKDITLLRGLANQTALALRNIEQTKRLSELYQIHLQSQEAESNRLARELHDEVLGQLAMVMMNLDRPSSQYLDEAYQTAVNHIRTIIEGLRPALLNYGLYTGLQNLVDEIQSLASNDLRIELLVAASQTRYPSEVEFHLYRIVQQACHNVLEHAQASSLILSGRLKEDRVELTITDNGIGLDTNEQMDLSNLLSKRHFGLAGMYERAELIGARIQILSKPDQGTQVELTWHST